MSFLTQIETQTTSRSSSFVREALIVLGSSLLIGLFAKIAIPLPFTPVPLATQAQLCLFLGALLGSKRGSLAVLLFLGQGSLGFPVFATGIADMAWLFTPRAGYVLGYLFGTFLTGYLVERTKERTMKTVFLHMALGNLVIFACGYLHLTTFVGFVPALVLGVLPFLLGDAFKLLVAVRALKALRVFW